MSNTSPIPLSAKRTDVFTPPALKPRPIPGEPKREPEGDDPGSPGTPDRTEGGDREVAFVIRVPTPSERDTIGSRLFELGLMSPSQETIRATMIDDLYNLDWGKGDKNEEHADELATFLDNYWSRQSIEEHATTLWQEQEAQRLLDKAQGVEKDAAPQPAKAITVREHSRAKLLIDDVMARSSRVRSLVSKQMDYGRLNALLMARIHLLAIQPADGVEIPDDIELERGADGLVTVDAVDRLREFMGNEAWGQLIDRIDGHYSLSEEERKNSDLPPESQSDPTGSPGQSGDSENSAGSSTASSTGPAPTDESATTTGRSSVSSSASAAERPRRGQTAKG